MHWCSYSFYFLGRTPSLLSLSAIIIMKNVGCLPPPPPGEGGKMCCPEQTTSCHTTEHMKWHSNKTVTNVPLVWGMLCLNPSQRPLFLIVVCTRAQLDLDQEWGKWHAETWIWTLWLDAPTAPPIVIFQYTFFYWMPTPLPLQATEWGIFPFNANSHVNITSFKGQSYLLDLLNFKSRLLLP